MKDYVEDFKYNNCFWKKSGVLYTHAKTKFDEFMNVGEIFKTLRKAVKNFIIELDSIQKFEVTDSTRGKGIIAFIEIIGQINKELKKIHKNLEIINKAFKDKNESYLSKNEVVKMSDENYKKYQNEIDKLVSKKNQYTDAMNKAIEYFLNVKVFQKRATISNKAQKELNDKKSLVEQKKNIYKKQIEEVELARVEYMEVQGNVFSSVEIFEKECTDDIKSYFEKMIGIINTYTKIQISDEKKKIISEIDGEKDNKNFAQENKSLMTGPKRNLYKEYAQDMNYYKENFDIVKNALKNKEKNEAREINKKINQEIGKFIEDIIKEEPDDINKKIIDIAKRIKESKAEESEYEYVITQFQKHYEQFLQWKKGIHGQDFKKVGKEWDERFIYMHTFLGYFNKTRIDSKELDKTNFEYLKKVVEKILELNDNDDIDYALCDLVVILSGTFYTKSEKNKSGKMYLNEILRESKIMQRQGFWVGLTRYELNEEIQQQNKVEDTLKEDEISEDKINNSITAKIMSVAFNIIQFVRESTMFNKIIHDIFVYCKISDESRNIVIEMLTSQLSNGQHDHLKLDKALLLETNKKTKKDEKEEGEKKVEEVEVIKIIEKKDEKIEDIKDINNIEKKDENGEEENKIIVDEEKDKKDE